MLFRTSGTRICALCPPYRMVTIAFPCVSSLLSAYGSRGARDPTEKMEGAVGAAKP